MALKMKALTELTGESKSTILYYVKEGLLPAPSKPKPNVHLYDESCVQIVKFIKHLQHNFSYSIAEIKKIFQNNRFDFDSSFEMMLRSLELISGGSSERWYSRETLLELTGMPESRLDSYEEKGYLFERAKGFSDKELEIAEILERAYELGLDCKLLDAYVEAAKTLALKENEIGATLLKDDVQAHDDRYALLFDLVLNIKPYIFNMHTVEAHQKMIKKGSV